MVKKKNLCHKNQIIFKMYHLPCLYLFHVFFVPFLFSPLFLPHLWNVCIYVHAYLYIHIGASLVAQMVRNCLQCRRRGFNPWIKIPWRRECDPLRDFCLEKTTDRGAWQTTVLWHYKESDTTEGLSTHTDMYVFKPQYV